MTVQPAVLAGQQATYFPADLDAPHSWTYTVDTARTAIAAGEHGQSWGRAWHVPSTADLSVRQLTQLIAEAAGTAPAGLAAMTRETLAALTASDTMAAEVTEMLYMTERPAILDSRETRRLLGIQATPVEEVVAEIVKAGGAPHPANGRTEVKPALRGRSPAGAESGAAPRSLSPSARSPASSRACRPPVR
jgi:nucleoside-diphosphate-sugar epimerase